MTNPSALAPCVKPKLTTFPTTNLHSPLLLLLPPDSLWLIPTPSCLSSHTHRAGLCGQGQGRLILMYKCGPGSEEGSRIFGNSRCGLNTPQIPSTFWFLSLLFWYPISLATTKSNNYANLDYTGYFKFLFLFQVSIDGRWSFYHLPSILIHTW